MSEPAGLKLSPDSPADLYSAAIPVGFTTAVSMWAVGYAFRLPFVEGPPFLLFFLLIALVIWGGRLVASRHLHKFKAAIVCGVTVAILDLLVLGSFVVPEGESLSGSAWLSAGFSFLFFIAVCIALAVFGAWTGTAASSNRQQGLSQMSWTAFAATLLLVGIGGLVTSEEAGMAVPDWPDSFGSNMFLLPFSRMTGGIYYEHAHRLFGALVGLVTISLAIYLWRRADSRLLTGLGIFAVVLVIFQGVLGGLRVTEVESATVVNGQVAEWGESQISLFLRVFHGVQGQCFLALLALIVSLTSSPWRNSPPGRGDRFDHWSTSVLLLLLLMQLIMGALSRHISRDWVIPHLLTSFLILALVVLIGVRGGLPSMPPMRAKLGILLVICVVLQVAIGFATLALTGSQIGMASSGTVETLVATLHQTLGALILSLAASLTCWSFRWVR